MSGRRSAASLLSGLEPIKTSYDDWSARPPTRLADTPVITCEIHIVGLTFLSANLLVLDVELIGYHWSLLIIGDI